MGNVKSKIKDLKLHKSIQRPYNYVLSATYEVEDDTGIYIYEISDIYLPLASGFGVSPSCNFDGNMPDYIDLGFGSLPFDATNGIKKTKIMDKPKKKMTVEEIEKQLGYKVEIVSEK